MARGKAKPLMLHEELLLLALRDRQGTAANSCYTFALGGAAIAELLMQNRVELDQQGKKQFVQCIDRAPTGDEFLDMCLEKIATAKRRSTIQTWVARLAGTKQLKHRIARALCEKGILKDDQDKVLIFFRRRIYPEVDPAPEREIKQRLKAAIFSATRDVAPRTTVLISLAQSADLLKHNFDRKKLKQRKKRIDQLVAGEVTGQAAAKAIQAMQTAVIVAAVIPAMAATMASG